MSRILEFLFSRNRVLPSDLQLRALRRRVTW